MTSLRQMLVLAGAQFTAYAQNHRAKAGRATDPAVVFDTTSKAEANEAMARRINESLREAAEFPEMVARLQKPGEDILEQMTPLKAATLHMACGAAFETGELGDAVKRWVFYGKEIDVTNVIEELGDIEFYLEGLRQNLAIDRETTLLANRNKLEGHNGRYKDGYSDAAAILRADKQVAGGQAQAVAAAQAMGAPYGESGEFMPASSRFEPKDQFATQQSAQTTALGEPRVHSDDVLKGIVFENPTDEEDTRP